MRIVEVTRRWFPEWKRLRQSVYKGLDESFHDEEMELLFGSLEATSFLGFSEDGEAIGVLELSLRNFVDGCLGGPVGYIEGIYLTADYRGQGLGREMIEFAAEWFRSKGCEEMAADSELENTAAQRFFVCNGFEETFRVVEFKKTLKADVREEHG